MWFGGVAWSASWLGAVGHVPGTGNVGAAVLLAVASTGCYAASAVLQEREAGRQDAGGAALLRGLVRRPWWWLAVAATVAGAVLHVAALASGLLSPVQPFGAPTLVLALPLGRVLGGRPVTGRDGAGPLSLLSAGAAPAVLPHRAPFSHLPLALVLTAVVGVAALVVALAGVAAADRGRCCAGGARGRGGHMFRFRLRDGTNRDDRSHLVPARRCAGRPGRGGRVGVGASRLPNRRAGSTAGYPNPGRPFGRRADRRGPLGEPVHETPTRAVVGVLGLAATTAGIWILTGSQRSRSGRTEARVRRRPTIVGSSGPVSESPVAHRPRRTGYE